VQLARITFDCGSTKLQRVKVIGIGKERERVRARERRVDGMEDDDV